MKRFGRISELFKLIFRDAASNEEIEIVPNSSTTYTATTTVELPEDDSTTQELVGVSANQTLDNKTIDATAATGTNTLAADATDIVYDPSGESLTAVDVQDALDEVAVRLDNVEADAGGAQQDIDDHIAETTGAHAATAISYDDSASSITAANIQEAVDAVDADAQQALSDAADAAQDAADVASDLSDHETESTGAHAATAISYDPTTASITSTEVQGAIDELDSDIADVASDLSDHETESTGAHAATAISYDNSVSGFPGTTEVQGALDATYTVFDNFANTTQSHINASSGVHGVTGSVVGTTDTQSLSGKTFTDDVAFTSTGAIKVPEGTGAQRPGTPAEGMLRINSDTGKFEGFAGGLWGEIAGGAGSGEVNYVVGPDDATGWQTSNGAAVTVATTTTQAEIPRFPFVENAIKVAPSGATTGAYVFTNVEIGDADMGKLLKIEWAQSVGSAFTSSDYLLEVRPATDDTFSSIGSPIPLAQWDGDDEYKIDALPGQLATFVPTSKWVQVRIVKDSSTDDANAWISLNTVTVGPSKNLVGPTITKSETYTPALTNFGTVSTNTGIYNRSGSYLDLDVFIVTTGSGSGGTVTVGLPSGLTIDTARLSGGASNNSSVGSANFFRSSTHIAHTPVAGTSTGNGIGLLEEGVATLVTGPDIASGQVIRINARLPILEWRDTGVTRMLTPNELYQSAQVKYRVVNSSVAVSAGATVPYDVEDSTLDKVGDWSNTGGVITFNQPGRYVVRAKLFTTAPTTPAAGAGNLSCQVDSGSGFETRFLGITNGTREIIATDVVNVKRGNQLRMIATALTIDALLHNTLTIARIPDRTEGSPIGVALATSEHAGLVELSDDFIANSSRPGLMPIFEQFTINLTAGTSDFSAGSAVLTKVGNLITLCSLTATVNSSLANPTASGAIPSGYRPSEVKSNCMIGSDTVLRFVQVDTSGNLSVYAKNYSGTTINNVGTVAYWSLQWTI